MPTRRFHQNAESSGPETQNIEHVSSFLSLSSDPEIDITRYAATRKARIARPLSRKESVSTRLPSSENIFDRSAAIEKRLNGMASLDSPLNKFGILLGKWANSLYRTVGWGAHTRTFKPIGSFAGHQNKVYDLHWSGNNDDFVSVGFDGKLLIWNKNDYNDPRMIVSLRCPWVMACAFEQSRCSLVAAGGLDNLVTIYQIPEVYEYHLGHSYRGSTPFVRSICDLSNHSRYISSCRFAAEHRVLTASGDHTCMLWDIVSGTCLETFKGHTSDVMSVSVQPTVNPDIFASGGCDGKVRIWDCRNPQRSVAEFGSNNRNSRSSTDINSVDLFLGGTAVAAGGEDGTVRVFDLRRYQSRPLDVTLDCTDSNTPESLRPIDPAECCTFASHNSGPVRRVAASRSGRLIFSAVNESVEAWEISRSKSESYDQFPSRIQKNHFNRISAMGISPNGDYLCSGGWDKRIEIYSVLSASGTGGGRTTPVAGEAVPEEIAQLRTVASNSSNGESEDTHKGDDGSHVRIDDQSAPGGAEPEPHPLPQAQPASLNSEVRTESAITSEAIAVLDAETDEATTGSASDNPRESFAPFELENPEKSVDELRQTSATGT